MSCLMTKPTKWHVHPAKTQISLGIRPVWSESSLCAQWVAKDQSFLLVGSKGSDQTGLRPGWSESSLGAHAILLVLSWGGSNIFVVKNLSFQIERSRQTVYTQIRLLLNYMILVMRKPVFGVCDQVRLKPACSAKEASWNHEIANIETRDIILSWQRTTKVLIRLRECACWSVPLLIAYGKNGFSHDVAHMPYCLHF